MLGVRIQGFQSIEEVSLTIDGFTALVGRSNIGKSAIVRAVQSALTNALGTDFVRHGEFCSRKIRGTKKCRCQCSVHLKTEGFDLLWEKGDEVNQYTYNGEVYSRVDRGIPDFLTEGFSSVKIGDKKQLIQVAEQSEPIFLLNQPGTVVADVLADVAKLDEINLAMADVERDRREISSVLKIREKDVLELNVALQFYEGLDDPVQRTKAISQLYTIVEEQIRKKSALDAFHERFRDLGTGIRLLQSVEGIEIPDGESVGAEEKGFSVLLRYESELEAKTFEVASLGPVEGLLEPDTDTIEAEAFAVLQIVGWLLRASEVRSSLTMWKAVEATKDLGDPPAQLANDLIQLTSFEGQYQTLRTDVEELEGVELTSDPEESVHGFQGLLDLTEFSDQHTFLVTSISSIETTLYDLNVQETAVIEECKALGVCPTCSQDISETHPLHFDA